MPRPPFDNIRSKSTSCSNSCTRQRSPFPLPPTLSPRLLLIPRSLASILLLSDGAQTRGLLSPGQGAERAQTAGIQVFTIALGTDGGTILAGPPGAEQVIPVPPDRETLSAIAEYTGAEAFEMGYVSARHLCFLAEGMISGAAAYYGETVTISQPECMHAGAARCLIRCSFQETEGR